MRFGFVVSLLATMLLGCGGGELELGGDREPMLQYESALSASVVAAADSWTRSASVDANKGREAALQVDLRDDSGGERRAFLKFTVSGISGRPINSAKLLLRCTASSNRGGTLHAVSDASWGETTITWRNQPAHGAALATVDAVTAGQDVAFDVSAIVKGDGRYAFALLTSSDDNAQYASRENSTGAPRLVLTFGDAVADAGTATPPQIVDAGAPSSADAGTVVIFPPTAPVVGIWTSASELANKPMSGAAWTTLVSYADDDTSNPNISNQDDPTNVRVLAAAIVYARSGSSAYKTKVVAALQKVIGTEAGGRTLAWGREVGAYAIAADLVGYRTAAFEAWLEHVTDGARCSQLGVTLRQMFRDRPNNWGAMAFGSLAAVDRYLGNTAGLNELRSYWTRMVVGPNPGAKYGSDLSWHIDASNLRLINPKGAVKQGVNIDGIIPDDMRRGGAFTTGAPAATGYPWEHLQGALMGARILDRAGLQIWTAGDNAIYRAAYALQVRLGGTWQATGDDLWQLAFLDQAYGTSWAAGKSVYGAGKNAGFAYVLP